MGLSQKLIAIGLLLCEAQSNRKKSHRSQDVGRITPDILPAVFRPKRMRHTILGIPMIRSYEGNLKANNCVKKYIFNRKAEGKIAQPRSEKPRSD